LSLINKPKSVRQALRYVSKSFLSHGKQHYILLE